MNKAFSKQQLLEFFSQMLKIRYAEESLVEPILSGEVRCPCHLYSGQEATAVGVCSSLNERDLVFGNHRSHGHYLAMGGDLKAMMAEIYCRVDGCCSGRGGSMHLIAREKGFLGAAPIVAGTISLALGSAFAAKYYANGQVAVSFFGDGATGEGVLYESMNFAALHKLPLVFVCENNLYSTHMPINEIRCSDQIYKIAEPFNIPANQVDGNDVIEVASVAQKAVELCRGGNGPFFLEARTYRMRGHVGPNDNIQGTQTDIRPTEEVCAWAKRDPIEKLQSILNAEHKISLETLEEIKQNISREITDAHEYARQSPRPDESEVMKNVYAD